MSRRVAAVVASRQRTSEVLVAQMAEVLHGLPGAPSLVALSVERGLTGLGQFELVLISSPELTPQVTRFAREGTEGLTIRRTLTKDSWARLMALPPGTRAMLVNDDQESACEVIALIHELGAKHLDLVPVSPQLPDPPALDMAITPGEAEFVPPGVQTVIDIGPRVVDGTTLVDLLSKFGAFGPEANRRVSRYMEGTVCRSPGLVFVLGRMASLREQLQHVINAVDQGVVGFDLDLRINLCNGRAATMLGRHAWMVLGRPVTEVLQGILREEDFRAGTSVSDQVLEVGHHRLLVNVLPVIADGAVAGGVITLRESQEVQRSEARLRIQLRQDGRVARYTFADMRGVSEAMRSVIERAERFSRSSSSVLILGESGTGKEILAQAIHNASPRASQPFVAVNCAAIPETLLESELFGYEEGAFTGARRGGRTGLFEQAHGGTIFLDEVGDMPLGLQARILRVLQEKEVVRVGGTRVVPVDVRVIAASNQDLGLLVEQGAFRRDLYYRLSVLPLRVPPLRERPEDVVPLVQYFLRTRGTQLVLSPQAVAALTAYPWPGNVRELENCVEYLMHVCQGVVRAEDLPEQIRSCCRVPAQVAGPRSGEGLLEAPVLAVLNVIALHTDTGAPAGRRRLSRLDYLGLTEYQLRVLMSRLQAAGLVRTERGRIGVRITDAGRALLGWKQDATGLKGDSSGMPRRRRRDRGTAR